MQILVCVKQVPDANAAPLRIDPATRRMVRTGVDLVLDPGNEVALEEALRLAERTPGSSVTVLSMGPEQATEAIRRAVAMGANEGVLVTDAALAGSDALSTARALAAAARQQQFDVIFCATESTDASTGMVPGMLAELLGVPHLSFIRQMEIDGSRLTAHRATTRGYQVVETELPVVISVASGVNEPRYPALRGIMAAKRKQIQTLDVQALGLAADEVGEQGARERVVELTPVEERAAGEVITDDGSGGVRIADFLDKVGVL